MDIKMPNRNYPEEFKQEIEGLTNQGLIFLSLGQYGSARNIFSKMYNLLLQLQEKDNRSIHKGLPLHNLGIALFYLKKPDDAIYHILCAYVEDTLNVEYDHEDNTDRYPAASVLRDLFSFNLKILREIKNYIFSIKAEGKWNSARDPALIVKKITEKLNINPSELSKQCERIPSPTKPLLGFPQPKESRVFIGTNYDQNPIVIPIVRGAAISKGYFPVAAIDYGIRQTTTHDDCLILLHTCKYAVFDITSPGGQLMELERTRDYNLKVLLVRQTVDLKLPPIVSSMVKTLGYKIKYYNTPNQLFLLVTQFLP